MVKFRVVKLPLTCVESILYSPWEYTSLFGIIKKEGKDNSKDEWIGKYIVHIDQTWLKIKLLLC